MNKDDINEIDEQEVEEWFSEEELDDSEVQTEENIPKQTKEEDISSKYANTQNKVNNADFSANNPALVAFEKLSRYIFIPPCSSSHSFRVFPISL